MTIITTEEIQDTQTYKNASVLAQNFLIKRANREQVHHALNVYKNTNEIPGNIQGKNLALIKEIIFKINNPEPDIKK